MNHVFEIACGTVIGRDHLVSGKNNHDACHWFNSDQATIAVVCDGCGSGKHSEVGAKLGARLIVEALIRRLSQEFHQKTTEFSFLTDCLERVRQDVLAQLRIMANGMGSSLSQTVSDYFLFTIVGALVFSDEVTIFSLGDGVYALNGDLFRIGPFPGNTPPYLAYGLVGSSLQETHPELLKFQINHRMAGGQVQSLLIGSDGVSDLMEIAGQPLPGKNEPVGPINQFWDEERYFSNPDAIRRKLAQINTESKKPDWNHQRMVKEPGLLPDDTTLVVLRRNKATRDTMNDWSN